MSICGTPDRYIQVKMPGDRLVRRDKDLLHQLAPKEVRRLVQASGSAINLEWLTGSNPLRKAAWYCSRLSRYLHIAYTVKAQIYTRCTLLHATHLKERHMTTFELNSRESDMPRELSPPHPVYTPHLDPRHTIRVYSIREVDVDVTFEALFSEAGYRTDEFHETLSGALNGNGGAPLSLEAFLELCQPLHQRAAQVYTDLPNVVRGALLDIRRLGLPEDNQALSRLQDPFPHFDFLNWDLYQGDDRGPVPRSFAGPSRTRAFSILKSCHDLICGRINQPTDLLRIRRKPRLCWEYEQFRKLSDGFLYCPDRKRYFRMTIAIFEQRRRGPMHFSGFDRYAVRLPETPCAILANFHHYMRNHTTEALQRTLEGISQDDWLRTVVLPFFEHDDCDPDFKVELEMISDDLNGLAQQGKLPGIPRDWHFVILDEDFEYNPCFCHNAFRSQNLHASEDYREHALARRLLFERFHYGVFIHFHKFFTIDRPTPSLGPGHFFPAGNARAHWWETRFLHPYLETRVQEFDHLSAIVDRIQDSHDDTNDGASSVFTHQSWHE